MSLMALEPVAGIGNKREVASPEKTPDAGLPQMAFHPLAETFPLMKGAELNALADDIKRSGQRDDIVLYENQILDGRCRYLACKAAGIEARFVAFTGNDPVAYVLSKNLPRRHLTASQRAIAAATLLPLYEAEAKKRMLAGRADPPARLPEGGPTPAPAAAETPGEAREKVGKMVGVSPKYISDAKKIEAVAPQEIPAIKAGTKTIPQVLKEIAPKLQPVEFNAELRWADVEAYLKHEREFWPVEHLGYLSTHLATLLMSWEPTDEISDRSAHRRYWSGQRHQPGGRWQHRRERRPHSWGEPFDKSEVEHTNETALARRKRVKTTVTRLTRSGANRDGE